MKHPIVLYVQKKSNQPPINKHLSEISPDKECFNEAKHTCTMSYQEALNKRGYKYCIYYLMSCMKTHQETPQPRRNCQLKKHCLVQLTIQWERTNKSSASLLSSSNTSLNQIHSTKSLTKTLSNWATATCATLKSSTLTTTKLKSTNPRKIPWRKKMQTNW